jgi:hypothetical protein
LAVKKVVMKEGLAMTAELAGTGEMIAGVVETGEITADRIKIIRLIKQRN